MLATPVVTSTAIASLNDAAPHIQQTLIEQDGEQYALTDIEDILTRWLESAIESLCEDACALCVTGDRTHASFNRDVFQDLLRGLDSQNLWDMRAEAIQEERDQRALALGRAA